MGQKMCVSSYYKGGKMYRNYENIYKLEKQLKKLVEEYNRAVKSGVRDEILITMAIEIEDLKQRINFVCQGEER